MTSNCPLKPVRVQRHCSPFKTSISHYWPSLTLRVFNPNACKTLSLCSRPLTCVCIKWFDYIDLFISHDGSCGDASNLNWSVVFPILRGRSSESKLSCSIFVQEACGRIGYFLLSGRLWILVVVIWPGGFKTSTKTDWKWFPPPHYFCDMTAATRLAQTISIIFSRGTQTPVS